MARRTILTLLRIHNEAGGAYCVEAARPVRGGLWRVEILDPFSRQTLAYCDGASRRDGRAAALEGLRRGFLQRAPFKVVGKPAPAGWRLAMGVDR
jgi:hypothetical protein